MRRSLVILALACACAAVWGCAEMELSNPFAGMSARPAPQESPLLGVSMPAGLKAVSPQTQGAECYRGSGRLAVLSSRLHAQLRGGGWNLRLAAQRRGHATYVYERGATLAVLLLEEGAFGTEVRVAAGERLPDGADLALPEEGAAASPQVETFAAPSGKGEKVETWGGQGGTLEERSL